MKPKFFITGLPRSRTAWLAVYFNCLGQRCLHDGFKNSGVGIMENYDGNVDSGLMLTNYELIYPDAKVVIIERPLRDVANSIQRMGLVWPTDAMLINHQRQLNLMKGLRVKFHEIDRRLEEITTYCGVDYDVNVSIMMRQMHVEKIIEYKGG